MEINHLASGSSGNSIVVDDGYSKLMLDVGLPYNKLSKRVRFSEIDGILVTHEHMDHSKAVPELLRRGHRVYMSKGTAKALDLIGWELVDIRQKRIGGWYVIAFDTEHDAAEPVGFLCQSITTDEKLVYITDSAYVNYNFTGVTHWIIEANYADHILEESNDEEWLKDRIRRSHFSFDDLCRFFDDSDLSQTDEIHLVHLSDRNSHEEEFKRKLQSRYGLPVYTISDSIYPKHGANAVHNP